jgi:hypothetical protein
MRSCHILSPRYPVYQFGVVLAQAQQPSKQQNKFAAGLCAFSAFVLIKVTL